eukprot:gb/GEZN01018049.1/.p2 GENE.gb/GEZN01018049.1/~~gb/GEZN01018049.1/.p2  ORF type:complete len:102 (-),score=17.44 gb/GEZN01018049.1/:242-547(-)
MKQEEERFCSIREVGKVVGVKIEREYEDTVGKVIAVNQAHFPLSFLSPTPSSSAPFVFPRSPPKSRSKRKRVQVLSVEARRSRRKQQHLELEQESSSEPSS